MDQTQQIAIIAKNVNNKMVDCIAAKFDVPILIITPNGSGKIFRNIDIIDDNQFLNRDAFLKKCSHARPGWIYQQFLKYQVVIKSKFKNTLIIDGDSLIKDEKFLLPLTLYYTEKPIEKMYNDLIRKKLGEDFVIQKNYITNQMNFNKEMLILMLNTAFESPENYEDCIMNFLQENPGAEFSEYQTYAAWLENKIKPNNKQIKVFRRHDLINIDPIDSLEKYDLIAFEYGHKTDIFRTIRARILYSFAKNLG